MDYLTYDKYKEIGGILELAAFNRYSVRSFAVIAQETSRRIDNMKQIPIEVEHLCRDLIEYMHNNLNQDKALSSSSHSQGGVTESESYVNNKPSEHEQHIDNLISDYLGMVTDDVGTPLLYRGCL